MTNEKRLDLISRSALLAELTDRQAFLIKEWGHRDHYTRGFEEAFDKVEQAPTVDAVGVVRCKDCKNYFYSSVSMGMRCRLDGTEWGKDDFCSCGERKDNG